jgi:AmmeMemoRadiSam system protein B
VTLSQVRSPAVAGTFYPGTRRELEGAVRSYLGQTRPEEGDAPKALIAPHAGYAYSGPIAASAYALLAPVRERIERVVLLGPAHRVFVRGLAAPDPAAFATPLGEIPIDRAALERLAALPQVSLRPDAHAPEHSLEVHLPFLQVVLDEFSLVPLVVGDASGEEVAEVLEALWGGPETLIVVSSDLSHYESYATARRMDAATTRAIEALRPEGIRRDDACGRVPIQGLLRAARSHGLNPRTLDVRNSGDTAGPRDAVVGYGAWAFA